METIRTLIRKKPVVYVVIIAVYTLLVGILKWGMRPDPGMIWFVVGSAVGLYFLDAAEVFFQLHPSPFHSVVFCGLFSLVSLFVVTSSGSTLAIGLVLSAYVQIIGRQIGEWQIAGSLSSWFRMTARIESLNTQRFMFVVFVLVFFLESIIFIQ